MLLRAVHALCPDDTRSAGRRRKLRIAGRSTLASVRDAVDPLGTVRPEAHRPGLRNRGRVPTGARSIPSRRRADASEAAATGCGSGAAATGDGASVANVGSGPRPARHPQRGVPTENSGHNGHGQPGGHAPAAPVAGGLAAGSDGGPTPGTGPAVVLPSALANRLGRSASRQNGRSASAASFESRNACLRRFGQQPIQHGLQAVRQVLSGLAHRRRGPIAVGVDLVQQAPILGAEKGPLPVSTGTACSRGCTVRADIDVCGCRPPVSGAMKSGVPITRPATVVWPARPAGPAACSRGQAQVQDLDLPLTVQHQVRGLDVAVDQPVLVGTLQAKAAWRASSHASATASGRTARRACSDPGRPRIP